MWLTLTLPALITLLSHAGNLIRVPFAPFVIKAERIEAVEGGPIVVRVTLSYQGSEAARTKLGHPNGVGVSGPNGWQLRDIRVGRSIRPGYGHNTFVPGDQLSATLFLHHDYSVIPAGRVKVKIDWPIYDVQERGWRLIAHPSTVLDLDVPAASAERLAAIRDRMAKTLSRADVSPPEVTHVAMEVWRTKHRAFLPVVLQVLESKASDLAPWTLLAQIRETCPSVEKADAELLKYLSESGASAGTAVFWYWQGYRKPTLAAQELKGLMSLKGQWMRVLTYAVFGKDCDAAWRESLITELRELAKPQPGERVARLLRDLDSDRFAVREEATTALAEMGVFVEPALHRRLQESLSPEARRRIERIIARIEASEREPDCRIGMTTLTQAETAEAERLLKLFAAGDPSTWLSKQAKAALERRAERARTGLR